MEQRNPVTATEGSQDEQAITALEALLRATSVRAPEQPAPSGTADAGEAVLMGECVDAVHPTLRGRVLVRWNGPDGAANERWLPTLYRLSVRAADRVLLARVGNWDEHVVIGVIDGFARRPEAPRREGASLELALDEALMIRGADGVELVEIRQEERGPVVKLLQSDVDLELPGALRLRAEDIRLEARQGRVELSATDDVVVRGEIIRLN